MGRIRGRILALLCGAAVFVATPAAAAPALAPSRSPSPSPSPSPSKVVPDATWDKVAACESDGDWAANTGNGYYGGLQIWPPTWREAGGLRFASRPDRATRRQQITVAQEILRRQGWHAWSSCARAVGLLH